MKLVNIEFDIQSLIPYTMWWFEKYEELIRRNGYEIIIRDTDHQYNSVRYHVEKDGCYSEQCEVYERELRAHLQTHCCRCGSTQHVSIIDLDDVLFSTLCKECVEIVEREARSEFEL